jgi:Cyclic nucleotide-binding domain
MRAVLDYCTGGIQRNVPAGTLIIHEGGTTGHLYVLIEGRLEVIKGDTIVASIAEPGAVVGEMSVLLDQPHTATVRAAAGATAQCRHHLSRQYHASIRRPRRSSRDGRRDSAEHDQPAADKGRARFGSAIGLQALKTKGLGRTASSEIAQRNGPSVGSRAAGIKPE